MPNFNASPFQLFFKSFDPFGVLSNNQKDDIYSKFEILTVEGKTHLLKPDMACEEVYFVLEGFFISYTPDGNKNKITGFYDHNKFMTDVLSQISPCSSRIGFVCLSKAIVLSMKTFTWKQLCLNNPCFQDLDRNFTLRQLYKSHQRQFQILGSSTEKLIQQLKELHPGILKIVTQNQIANYLGVTAQGVSKILKDANKKST